MEISFYINSVLLGIALAMDAFSVSCANGLNEPDIKKPKMCLVATIFGSFQTIMPLIGWFCVTTIVGFFSIFSKFIPWISLILLSFLGIKMIIDALHSKEDEKPAIGLAALLLQGIATSIDALSVGFTISTLRFSEALIECLIIGIVTFIICLIGLEIGKKFGNIFSGRATFVGGIILIFIGLEIFLKGIL